MFIDKIRISLYQLARSYLVLSNISGMWSIGVLLGMILVTQIVTGIALSCHYTGHTDLAFWSVEHIMRDVNFGWILRYAHSNGASMFFILTFLHIARGLYYVSYTSPRILTWTIGVVILLVMMGTAFIGYVLVWGAMSFWGATVITNMLSAIPFFGQDLVQWVWGGFSVDNPTLTRFFSLHYLLPFILALLAILHLLALHETGSSNPTGLPNNIDSKPFHPYYSVKDIQAFILMIIALSFLVFFVPNLLGHPDNYIPANPLVTPAHIVPEWYFLFAYSILRSIPNKALGVAAMGGSILILMVLPLVHTSKVRSTAYRPISKFFFWIFIMSVFLLTWTGSSVAEEPYITIGQLSTVWYFIYFLLIIPIIGLIENKILFTPLEGGLVKK